MSQQDQNKIYLNHNDKRMFVISTNVAETSLTIPNIRYVIDSGKVKKRIYKTGLSFSSFQVEWISQASANQRTGRAGRTCEGYCYRLYSNGLYVKMPQFTEPQILTTPLSQVILTLKSMKVNNIYTFPFITFPNQLFITKAIEHLTVIGALQSKNDEHELRLLKLKQLLLNTNNDNNESNIHNELNDSTTISDLGMLMSKFPLEPKLSKVLIMAKSFGLIEYGIMIVGLLSVETPFDFNCLSYSQLVNVFKEHNIYNYKSDIISYVNLLLLVLQNKLQANAIKYHQRKIEEIKNIINQLYSISISVFGKQTTLTPFTSLPLINSTQSHLLYQILLCAYIDNIARKQIIYINDSSSTDEQVLKKQIIYESN